MSNSPQSLVPGLPGEESLQLVEIFEDPVRARQHPPGSLGSGHAEHEIDRLSEPIRERDLGGRPPASGRRVVPERHQRVRIPLDPVEVPGHDLPHGPPEALGVLDLPSPEFATLLWVEVLLLVRRRVVEVVAQPRELRGQPAAPGPPSVGAVLDGSGEVDPQATPIWGQSGRTGHSGQRGFRARQIWRPWKINRCAAIVRCPRGTRAFKSSSTLTGSDCRVQPSRRAIRPTCVSTTKPSSFPNAFPRMTLAVLRPTPGSARRASIVSGTLPPCSAAIAAPAPRRLRALALKNPVVRMSSSSSPGFARA